MRPSPTARGEQEVGTNAEARRFATSAVSASRRIASHSLATRLDSTQSFTHSLTHTTSVSLGLPIPSSPLLTSLCSTRRETCSSLGVCERRSRTRDSGTDRTRSDASPGVSKRGAAPLRLPSRTPPRGSAAAHTGRCRAARLERRVAARRAEFLMRRGLAVRSGERWRTPRALECICATRSCRGDASEVSAPPLRRRLAMACQEVASWAPTAAPRSPKLNCCRARTLPLIRQDTGRDGTRGKRAAERRNNKAIPVPFVP